MWEVHRLKDDSIHVVPKEDWYKHDFHEFCSCMPVDKEGVWSHNSFDGRELVEEGDKGH